MGQLACSILLAGIRRLLNDTKKVVLRGCEDDFRKMCGLCESRFEKEYKEDERRSTVVLACSCGGHDEDDLNSILLD